MARPEKKAPETWRKEILEMCVLGEQLFLENNPFWAVQGREDLTALEKVREVMRADRADQERARLSRQAVSILRDPAILMAAVDANRRILTPLWRELLEEGQRDGTIQTRYARELSEQLPLLDFWLLPSVFPATAGELRQKYRFAAEVLAQMGLPILEGEVSDLVLADIAPEEKEEKE